MSESLVFLEQTAAARILVRLLEDGPRYMSQLYKVFHHPGAIAGQVAIKNARNLLIELNYIESYLGEETPRPRLYLRLTDTGRKVAEHLKEIQDLLSTNP